MLPLGSNAITGKLPSPIFCGEEKVLPSADRVKKRPLVEVAQFEPGAKPYIRSIFPLASIRICAALASPQEFEFQALGKVAPPSMDRVRVSVIPKLKNWGKNGFV